MDNLTALNITLNNMTIPLTGYRDNGIEYVTIAKHTIGLGEVILAIIGFIFLSYWLIRVSKNKELYTHWKNPNGREINLYSKVRLFFWLYTGVVILTAILQILFTNGRG